MVRSKNSHFTDEQLEHLRANPYVKSVSQSSVSFTEEFKQYFWHRLQEGVITRQIFIECGIDPDALGKRRMDGFRYSLKQNSKRVEGFSDKRRGNYRHEKNADEQSVELRLKQLEHELAYTRQEVEFLKKLQTADMEARKQWGSKHRPK